MKWNRADWFTTGFFVGIAATVLFCVWIAKHYPSTIPQETYAIQFKTFPSVRDWQWELKQRGYEIKVDGRLGPDTEKAWGQALGDWWGIFYIEKAEAEK